MYIIFICAQEAQDFSSSVSELVSSIHKGLHEIDLFKFNKHAHQRVQASFKRFYILQMQNECPAITSIQEVYCICYSTVVMDYRS